MTSAATDDPVKRLNRLDVCAVSDAMDKLGFQGSVTGLAQQSSNRRIAGRIVTYRLAAAADVPAYAGKPRHLGTRSIENSKPGDVVVVEQRTGIDAGCWGGILTLGAKLKGVAGVIADGSVRDIDEARTYDFPVYARGLTARTARGRVGEIETNGEVTIGDIKVRAGDYAIADASGIVFVPSDRILEVLAAAEMIAGREAAMTKSLLEGAAITAVMSAEYEHMLHPSVAP